MSYTDLRGVISVNRTDHFNTIQQNLVEFLDWGLLNKGAFANVVRGTSNMNFTDKSTLIQNQDPIYREVPELTWRTAHQNIVWESGITFSNQPITVSGVYVDGTFKSQDDPTYSHYIDYKNGVITFYNTVTPKKVQMEYSYKNVFIDKFENIPFIREGQFNALTDNNYTGASGVWGRVAQEIAQFPTIGVECTAGVTYKPTELGSSISWLETDVVFYVFANTQGEVRKYIDILGLQNNKTIFLYDIDLAISSGSVIRKDIWDKEPRMTYPELIEAYKFTKLYFDNARGTGPSPLGNGLYQGSMRFTVEVKPIR